MNANALTKARAARAQKLAERRHLQQNVPAAAPQKTNDVVPASTSPPQRQGDRGTKDDATPSVLRPWVRYRHLVAAGIISNWPQLLKLIEHDGFPVGKMISRNTRAWLADDIEAWLDDRPPPRNRKLETEQPEREDAEADQRERELA